jgi:glycosyltransferase involved in cell wall biosynthesis
MSLNILALEPYLGGSRKHFINGLTEYSRHTIIPITMSDRHLRWRMMGGGVTMAEYALEHQEKVDVIFASSTTNLTAFIALTNPKFAHTPVILYMHENQLTEPMPPGQKRELTYSYINYLSALAAQKVVFSSQYHLDSFFKALPEFLKQFPDYKPKDHIEKLLQKSEVLHPGIHLKHFDPHPDTRKTNKLPVILWNQRWSYDKDPAKFFRMMNRLDDAGFQFELILAGDNRHEKPEEFEKAWSRYGRRIIHYGFVEDLSTYCKLLHRADIVVSTSMFENYSVAIMEAVYSGCHPVVPNALMYPELIPKAIHNPLLHAPTVYNDEDHLFKILKSMLSGENKALPKPTLQNVNKHLDWSIIIHKYDALFESVLDQIQHL